MKVKAQRDLPYVLLGTDPNFENCLADNFPWNYSNSTQVIYSHSYVCAYSFEHLGFLFPFHFLQAPLPEFRSITSERGDHTWADLLASFMQEKINKKLLRGEKEERKGQNSTLQLLSDAKSLAEWEDGNTKVRKYWKSSLLQSGCILHPHSAVLFM